MIKHFLAGAACVAAFAVSATAGSMDVPTPTPTIVPVVEADKSWAGFYGGLSVNKTSGTAGFEPALSSAQRIVEDSTFGGAFIGQNWQRGNIIYGAEFNYSAINNELAGYDGPDYYEFDVDWDPLIEMRLRAGYALGDVLVYGFAGKSFTAFVEGADKQSLSGLTYGAGAQMYVYKDVFAGLEVSRRNYSFASPDSELNRDFEIEIDQISLRIGYTF